MATPKSKINKKFIILVAGFLLFAVAVLGGLFYWSYAGAPERNVAMGDALIVVAKTAETAGNSDEAYKKFQEAISRYGRAVAKKPNNLLYSQKMLDAIALITPKTSSDAQELNQTREGLLQKRTRSAPLDGAQWMMLLDSMTEQAQMFGVAEMWQRIVGVCDDALDHLQPTDTNVAAIRSLRICARLNQDEVLTAEERATAEAAVYAYLKDFPQSEEAWTSLLRSIASDSHRLAAANRLTEAKSRDSEFETASAQAKSIFPNSSKISIAQLQNLLLQRQLRNPLATPGSINAILDPILWENGNRQAEKFGTSSTLTGKELLTVSNIAAATQDPIVLRRAIAVLQNYCERFPGAIFEWSALGRLQKSDDQFEAAGKTFEQILVMPAPKVSLTAAYADEIKGNVLEEIFDIQFGKWENAKTAAEKTAALAQAEAIRARLSKLAVGPSAELAVLRADAKLAYAKGDSLTTVTKLEEVFARQKKVPAELYLLSVISLNERGEQGAALVKLNRAIDEYPGIAQFYMVRAGIEAKLGRLMDAKRSIANVIALDPSNSEAQRLMVELKKIPNDGAINTTDPMLKLLGDAELLANEGQVDEAIAQIRDGLVNFPKDSRLQRTLCQWLIFVGKTKEAQELLAKYSAENPNDVGFKQLQIVSTITSSIDRVKAFVNETLPDGTTRTDAQKAVNLALGLCSLRDSFQKRIDAAGSQDKSAIATELAQIATAAKDALAKAIELAPGDSVLLDRLYSEAIADKKPEQVEQLIVLAEKNCKDPTIALLLRGRAALDRNDSKKAIDAFEQATALPGASAAAFRLLGFSRERNGDVDGAREAYATSYERRPNDIVTVQLYSSLLARGGDIKKAREVMRSAMLSMPESPAVRNSYFDLEAIYGSVADSVMERRKMYAIRPSDVENARQLMRLLIESPVTREFMINADGSQKYPPKEWEAMGKERQDQEIQAVTRVHMGEAAVVYDRLLKMNPTDRISIRTYAAAMQRGGRGSEGEAFLLSTAQKSEGPNAWGAWIDLGELQLAGTRVLEAERSFNRAIELDTSKSSDAASVVSSMWSVRHQPARALEVADAAFRKTPTLELARTITALRLETHDLAGARAMNAEVTKLAEGKVTFSDRLLAADIANAELETLMGKSSEADYKRVLADFTKAIEDAIRIDPASELPFVVRASSYQRRFQRTGDPETARLAKLDVTRAIELRGNYWPSTRLLASILMDEGDVAGATQAVRKFVEQSPRSSEARLALIGYQRTAGEYSGAIKTAEDILKLEPKNPIWLQALSEAYMSAGQKLDAATAFERIFAITKNIDALVQAVLLRATNTPPDFSGILASMKGISPDLVQATPLLQMIGAAALSSTAVSDVQKNQGLFQLRELYKLVEQSKGGLTDPWIVAVGSLFPADKSTEMESFVLEACAKKPDSSLCRSLAQRFIQVGTAGYPKALEYANRALQNATTDDEKFNALSVLGGAEYKSGHFNEAALAFEKSLEIRKEDLGALNNLAYLEAKYLNKVPQAVERSRRAFVVNQTNPDVMDTLGYALMKSGELPEAINLLRRSARSQPTAMAYGHLAEAQAIGGRKSEATVSLERAKALRPDSDAQEQIDIVSKLLDGAPRS